MAINRYFATKDTVITNAYLPNLLTRGTGSNQGASDVLDVFSISAQANSSSREASRLLTYFPTTNIVADRAAGTLPVSGSVNFVLRLYNAPHSETIPKGFDLLVSPLSQSFTEGNGLDFETLSDKTRGGERGADWIFAGSGTAWSTQGGDFLASALSQTFDSGIEDLEVDITSLVENWVNGNIPNNGVAIRLSTGSESGSTSYYTKKFFARGTEFFFKRPCIEAKWNSSKTDDRNRFFVSSTLLSAQDNTHTLYFYNYHNGQLKNVPGLGTGSVFVQVFTSATLGDLITTTPTVITGGYVSTGIYSASFAISTTSSVGYDRWFRDNTGFHTGSFLIKNFGAGNVNVETRKFVNACTNLKNSYSIADTARLRIYSRLRNWSPTIYTKAIAFPENTIIENAYWKVERLQDRETIIPYGTGSALETKLSYDGSGSYFDFSMGLLEPGYAYAFKLLFQIDGTYEEQMESFKFRVV